MASWCRLAQLLQGGDLAHFEKGIKWLLTMTETVLVCFTQAMDSCQAAAKLQALKQDYERARHKYLQLLLDIAQSLGKSEIICSTSVHVCAPGHKLHVKRPS